MIGRTSSLIVWNSCCVFSRSQIQIPGPRQATLTDMSRDFPQSFQKTPAEYVRFGSMNVKLSSARDEGVRGSEGTAPFILIGIMWRRLRSTSFAVHTSLIAPLFNTVFPELQMPSGNREGVTKRRFRTLAGHSHFCQGFDNLLRPSGRRLFSHRDPSFKTVVFRLHRWYKADNNIHSTSCLT